MKTRNRLLAVLLTLVMLVGILPVSAFAESVVPAAGMDIAIWLGDTQVTDQNKDDILSDGGKAKYDPSTMTLTLNDPEISTVSPNGAVIEVNELDLTITGSATLNVSGADYGIGVWDGVLNINGNINATGVIGGIFVPRSDLNIDGGTVTAAATGTNVMGAVYTEGTLSISGGTVTAKAVNPGLNHGVYAGSGLILYGGSLDARGYYRGIGTMGAIDIGNDIDGLVAMGNNCGIAAGPAEISIGDLLNIVQPADGQLSSDKHTIVSAANPEVAAQIVEITPTSYTVRFMDGSTELDTQTVRHGAFATPPSPSPEKTGCIFFGWYTDESFTDSFDFGQSITADTDIYALFVSEYTVTLDMNGGKILDAEDAWQDSVSMEFYEGYEQEIPSVEWMNEMVADGNWIIGPANSEYIGAEITDANGVKNYQPGEMYTVVSDATIKVLWNSVETPPAPTTYTVTFKDGENVLSTVTVNSGEKVSRPTPDPIKSGYTFDDWYADDTFSAGFDFDQPITANTTVYAKFTKDSDAPPQTITYTVVDGDNAVWTKGTDAAVTITVKRSSDDDTCFSHFIGVEIDDTALVNGTDYTAVSGSTVVTLNASALQKLSVGSHTVTVNFDDGTVSTALTVKADGGSTDNPSTPKTGDESNLTLYCGLMLMSASGMIILFLCMRKRKTEES